MGFEWRFGAMPSKNSRASSSLLASSSGARWTSLRSGLSILNVCSFLLILVLAKRPRKTRAGRELGTWKLASMAAPSNDTLLERLKNGTATFQLLPPPAAPFHLDLLAPAPHRFFARIVSSLGGSSPAMKKVEHYSVQKVAGDGRCMFRALVKGMALNKGISLSSREEKDDADDLRMAVKEVLCDSDKERIQHEEALIAITVEESLKRYCQRINHSDFWGGESELLVLSKMCHQPIVVYIPQHEHSSSTWGTGYIPIAKYGTEFKKAKKGGKARKPVKLVYSGSNHYDLLV